MTKLLWISIFIFTVSCGKVAQDISDQSTKSVFEPAYLSTELGPFLYYGWEALPVTSNAIDVYIYAEGVQFEKGYEKIGWGKASFGLKNVKSKWVPQVVNYDKKMNTVTSSRYQQGFLKINQLPSDNYSIKTTFSKVRPKYDYYSFVQFASRDNFIFDLREKIPTQEVTVTPYSHLVSLTFRNHLVRESFTKENIIPLSSFYDIIPSTSVLATDNMVVLNTVKKFNPNEPLFFANSDYLDALLTVVNLSYHSEQFDVEDYISSIETVTFSDNFKKDLLKNVKNYFLDKKSLPNVVASPNASKQQ